MPWFRIDDKAHSHPKLIKAGNAALGLWLRCGSYAAQHLTDGIVPGVVAQLYGTKPQAAKLVKAGLWHEHGHDCPDGCPNPAPGDYAFHDFLEDGRNTSRARHEAERKKARDRQSKHREGARGARKGDGNADESKDFTFDSSSERSESASEESQSSDSDAGQSSTSRRDASVTGIHAGATPYPSTSYGSTGAAGEQRSGGLPDPLAELKRGIANAGLAGVAWDLRESGWEYTRQAMDRVGVAAMVAFAVNSARLKGVPAGASAWVQGWRTLEAPEEQGDVTYLPAAVGQTGPVNRQQQETNDMFDRAMARAKARRQQQEES
ncbi:mucin-2 [Streptomyces sp. NPDC055642]